jgi:hypothetical protein
MPASPTPYTGITPNRNQNRPTFAQRPHGRVRRPEDFTIILQAVRCYEQATGARLNPKKSKALAIGNWKDRATALGIEFHDQVTILGVTFGTTTAKSMKDSWAGVLWTVRAQARKAYARTLCLAQRIQYVQLCLFTKIWYLAQILPPTTVHVQQLTTVCSLFIWQGAIFRVPVSTLQRPKEHGVWVLANINVKRRTLLYARLWLLCARQGSITTAVMCMWQLTGLIANPLHANGLPKMIPYIRQNALDKAYVASPGPNETMKAFKLRLYGVLLTVVTRGTETSELRIISKYPELPWPRVWANLHAAGLPDTIKATWYAAIHDIIPTNQDRKSTRLNSSHVD